MIDTVIVHVDSVAVPVPKHHVQRHEGQESIQVERLLQPRRPPGQVRLPRGADQRGQIGLVVGMFAGVHRQFPFDIADKATVVKVALGVMEMPFEELFVPSLRHDIGAKLALVQFHNGMAGPRRRDPTGLE